MHVLQKESWTLRDGPERDWGKAVLPRDDSLAPSLRSPEIDSIQRHPAAGYRDGLWGV